MSKPLKWLAFLKEDNQVDSNVKNCWIWLRIFAESLCTGELLFLQTLQNYVTYDQG